MCSSTHSVYSSTDRGFRSTQCHLNSTNSSIRVCRDACLRWAVCAAQPLPGAWQRLTLLPPVKVMGGAGCVKCATTVATTCLPDHRGLGLRMAGGCSLMFTSWGLPAAGGGGCVCVVMCQQCWGRAWCSAAASSCAVQCLEHSASHGTPGSAHWLHLWPPCLTYMHMHDDLLTPAHCMSQQRTSPGATTHLASRRCTRSAPAACTWAAPATCPAW